MVDDIKNSIIDNNIYEQYVNHFNNGNVDHVKIYKIYIYNDRDQIKDHKFFWFDVYKNNIKRIFKDKTTINNVWNKLLNNAYITCGSSYAKDEIFYDYDEFKNYTTNELYYDNENLKKEIIREFAI